MSVPRVVEDTVTALLKDELEKRGVNVGQFMAFTTIAGQRRQPDLFLQNGGNHVVQAKLGDEAKTIEAMGEVWDSIRYHHVKGGFAVVYPDELRRPMPPDVLNKVAPGLSYKVIAIFEPRDPRPLLSLTGTLPVIAEWIAVQVLKPPKYAEPDIASLIKILRNAAQYLTLSLKHLQEKELEEIFGGRSVFENILQYEEGKYPLDAMRQAAAYLLINQLMFYHVLSRLNPLSFPEIDEDMLKSPPELMESFQNALKVDYSATFGFNVASSIPGKAIGEVRGVVKTVKALTPEKIRYDILGQLFHQLIPIETRKPVAAFYTNIPVAHLLAQLAINSPSAKGIRNFLAQYYNLDYIITTLQRSAFSEGAQFREMLLIARKIDESHATSHCGLVVLKKLPSSLEEARSFAQQIKEITSKLDLEKIYDDKLIVARLVSQDLLRERAENLYVLLAVSDLEIPKIWEEIVNRGLRELISLRSYLFKAHADFRRFDTWFMGHKLHEMFICDPSRAIKVVDKWVIRHVTENEIRAENRYTHTVLKIPLEAVRCGLRRPSGLGVMDLSDRSDFIVTKVLPKFGGLVEEDRKKEIIPILSKWKKFVEEGLGNLLFTQDLDISAPGTRLIAYHSSKPMVGEHMWSFKGLPEVVSKILTLWFNSTPYLLWGLLNRVEVRGAWIKFHSYLLDETPILDIDKLSEVDKKELLSTFERVRKIDFPSTLTQLKTKFPVRIEIDKTILKILGFSEEETEQLIKYLYPALANEIEILKSLMGGKVEN